MKLETIKRNNKKKIIIGNMIVLSVVGCLTLTITRAKYRNVQSLKLANGTIDYKSPDLKLAIKVSEDGTTYKNSNTIPEGNYTLNTEKSKCRIPTASLTSEDAPVAEGVSIEYIDGKINVLGVTKKDTRCYLYFDKVLGQTSSSIIADIKNRTDGSYKGSAKPTFTSVATGAETEDNNGIYETDDPMYGENAKTYYWRGAATTNHVIFADMCWRIVRINGDGSIRLIYNGTPTGNACPGNGSNAGSLVLSGTTYNSSRDNSSYVGWTYNVGSQRPSTANPQTTGTDSSIKIALEDWYRNNILLYAKQQITQGKFCNDRNVKDNAIWIQNGSTIQYYAAYQRLMEGAKTPTLSCSNGDIYMLDVGIITADEVQFAGASGKITNYSYYLYNGQRYWTISPSYWDGAHGNAIVFRVETSGYLENTIVISTSYGLRPVINLRSDVTFNSGSDGTQNNPYIVQ